MATDRLLGSVNGDTLRLVHPRASLDAPFTSHVDVLFDGVTHQLLTTRDRTAFDFRHTTGEFEVRGLRGLVVEHMDNVATSARHRHQVIVDTPDGVLSTHGYDGVERLLDLIGHLRPQPTPLGMTVRPRPGAELATARIALQTPVGLLQIAPLSRETVDQLPAWHGTPAAHGELYAATRDDGVPYAILVSETARVMAFVGAEASADELVELLEDLDATWTS